MSYEHRQSKHSFQFTGTDGKPIANQKIEIDQIGHEFLFGCGAHIMS